MIPSAARLGLCILALLAATAGCGDAPRPVPLPPADPAPVDPAGAGTLAVHLVKDGLGPGLVQLNLAITALEVRVAGAWRPVPLDHGPVAADVLACTSAEPLVLATGVPWPAGDNDAVRVTLDPGAATVQRREDAEPRALSVPARFVCAVGPPGAFTVSRGQVADLWLVFGLDRAIQALPEDPEDGQAPVAALVPAQVRGCQGAGTGVLAGRVVAPGPAGADPVGVANAVVTAQLGNGGGPASVRAYRTVRADDQGNFTLDLLAKGSAYAWTAVSLAVDGEPAYAGAAGSPAGPLGNGPPYDRLQCQVRPTRVLATGTLGGQVDPPGPGQGAWVDLVQALAPDSGPMLVATAPVAADGRFGFGPGLPVGIYRAVLRRFGPTPTLELAETTRTTQPFALSAGADLQIGF